MKEYLSYGGGNPCAWYNDRQYYDRSPGVTFGPEK